MTHPTPNEQDAMKDIERLADHYANYKHARMYPQANEARAALLDAIRKLVSSTQPAQSQDAQPVAWEPSFDACSVNQERLAREFCLEIAGRRGEKGSPPDPVCLLEMAQALYQAERDDLGPAVTPIPQAGKVLQAPAWISVEERMPDREERVLVYGAKRLRWAVAEWDERDGWQVETCSEFFPIYPPTHWMPLPPPPMQQAQDISKETGQ